MLEKIAKKLHKEFQNKVPLEMSHSQSLDLCTRLMGQGASYHEVQKTHSAPLKYFVKEGRSGYFDAWEQEDGPFFALKALASVVRPPLGWSSSGWSVRGKNIWNHLELVLKEVAYLEGRSVSIADCQQVFSWDELTHLKKRTDLSLTAKAALENWLKPWHYSQAREVDRISFNYLGAAWEPALSYLQELKGRSGISWLDQLKKKECFIDQNSAFSAALGKALSAKMGMFFYCTNENSMAARSVFLSDSEENLFFS